MLDQLELVTIQVTQPYTGIRNPIRMICRNANICIHNIYIYI